MIGVVLILTGCSDQARARKALREVGAVEFRRQTMNVCRAGFASGITQKIPEASWPALVRPFQPMGLWAEPDGAYLLITTDVEGEHGVFLPRFDPEKDPLCGPTLKHEKMANGIYWYDRKR